MRLSCAPTQDGKDTSPFECMNQKENSLGLRSPLPLTLQSRHTLIKPVTSVIEMHDQFYCPYLWSFFFFIRVNWFLMELAIPSCKTLPTWNVGQTCRWRGRKTSIWMLYILKGYGQRGLMCDLWHIITRIQRDRPGVICFTGESKYCSWDTVMWKNTQKS